jgi:sulfur-carrier protein adenylyltransferase/sulfurtransferase
MAFADWFKPLSVWSPDEVRRFLNTHEQADYYLVDAREAAEFAAGHLSGARSIPLSGLEEQVETLDPWRQTIVYCENGIRSRGAAAVLARAGFLNVHVLGGGLGAWEGAKVRALTEGRASVLASMQDPIDAVRLALHMEGGAWRFYSETAAALQHPYLTWVFNELSADEKKHQEALERLDLELRQGRAPDPRRDELPPPDLMEGGVRLSEVLREVRAMTPREVAELAVALEANAYDLHLRLERRTVDSRARKVFHELAASERLHLERVTRLLTGEMGAGL